MTTAASLAEEVKEMYNEALRDVGDMIGRRATELRKDGIRAATGGNELDAAYSFGAARALDEVADVFKNRGRR